MHNIANKFALWIAKNGGSENEQEIYAYGIECLLNTILVFGVIVIIGAILNRLPITLIWIIFFLPLRHASGGLHAPNHIGCFILSLSVGIGCLLLNPFLIGMEWLIIIGTIGSIIIIFAFAPVIHPNHPISEQQILMIKKTARIIIIVDSCLIVVLLLFELVPFAVASGLGILSASVSTFFGHLIDR